MESKTKLLDQMRHILRLKHLSIRTEKAYVQWAKRFILFHHKRHPADMGAPEIRAFLIHLAVEGQVAASTQNVALQALVFLYRDVLKQPFPALKTSNMPGNRDGCPSCLHGRSHQGPGPSHRHTPSDGQPPLWVGATPHGMCPSPCQGH